MIDTYINVSDIYKEWSWLLWTIIIIVALLIHGWFGRIKDHFETVRKMEIRLQQLERSKREYDVYTVKIMYQLGMCDVHKDIKDEWKEKGWIDERGNS